MGDISDKKIMGDMCEIMNWLDRKDGYMPTCQEALTTESHKGWVQQVRHSVFLYMQRPFNCNLERDEGDIQPVVRFYDEEYRPANGLKSWDKLNETERINFAVFYGMICEMKRQEGV